MNNNIIKKSAKKFLKSTKWKTDFVSAEKVILKSGYKVIFFNTSDGDMQLARYGLTEKATRTDAFTYNGTGKLIFINNTVSAEDKVYLLLHEIGHIMLGHLDYERLTTHNKHLLEFEADTFVHYVLNTPKQNKMNIVLLIAAVIAISALFFSLGMEYVKTSVIPINGVSTEADKVYITSTGTKFHRENCIHIQGREVFSAERKEAEITYKPCKVCNP